MKKGEGLMEDFRACPDEEKVLFLEAFEGSSDKEAILKAPLDPGARAGDRYSSPHRCIGLPEAAASGPWARSPWHQGYAAASPDSD